MEKDKKAEAMSHPDKPGAGAEKRKKVKDPQDKVEVVMSEFKRGTLRSGSGEKVTDRSQALAIAMSESGQSKKKLKGCDKIKKAEEMSPGELLTSIVELELMLKAKYESKKRGPDGKWIYKYTKPGTKQPGSQDYQNRIKQIRQSGSVSEHGPGYDRAKELAVELSKKHGKKVSEILDDILGENVPINKAQETNEMNENTEYLESLIKAGPTKYKRKWRGKDGKWRYEYEKPKKGKEKAGEERPGVRPHSEKELKELSQIQKDRDIQAMELNMPGKRKGRSEFDTPQDYHEYIRSEFDKYVDTVKKKSGEEIKTGVLPQKLVDYKKEHHEIAIDKLSKMPLKELRRRQDMLRSSRKKALEQKNETLIKELDVAEKHLIHAIDRKEFGKAESDIKKLTGLLK